MTVSVEIVVKEVVKAVNKQIADSYARQGINKLPEHYTVKKRELALAFREAYKHVYNTTVREGDTSWPDPTKGSVAYPKLHAGFVAAGQAAYDWMNRSLDQGNTTSIRVEGSSKSPIQFIQPKYNKHFFSQMKTAGLRVLSTYIKEAGGKEISFYADLKVKKDPDAHSKQEDMLFRRLLHREHRGTTTTGNAALSLRVQAYERISPGFFDAITSEKDKDITHLLGDITGSFELNLKSTDLIRLKNIKNKKMNLRLGSFKWNLGGKRASDLKETAALFELWATKALNKTLHGSKFINLLTQLDSVEQVRKHVGNTLAKTIIGDAGKATQARITGTHKNVPGSTLVAKPSAGTPGKVKNAAVSQFDVEVDKVSEITHLLNIRSILNRFLSQEIQDNMGKPRLTYRTGRLAESAYISDVRRNKARGTISTKFRYMEYPYRVFEKGGNMYKFDRDPRKLIEGSIKDIMKKHVINQLKERANINRMTTRRGEQTPYISKKEWSGGIET